MVVLNRLPPPQLCLHPPSFLQEYEECFSEMTTLPRYQNVASRMFSGHDAYDGDIRVCMREDSGEICEEYLESVVAGACNVNVIIITRV